MSGRSVGRLVSHQSPFTSVSSGYPEDVPRSAFTTCFHIGKSASSPLTRRFTVRFCQQRVSTGSTRGIAPPAHLERYQPLTHPLLRRNPLYLRDSRLNTLPMLRLAPRPRPHAVRLVFVCNRQLYKICASKKHTSRSRFSLDECGVLNVCPYIRTAIPC